MFICIGINQTHSKRMCVLCVHVLCVCMRGVGSMGGICVAWIVLLQQSSAKFL